MKSFWVGDFLDGDECVSVRFGPRWLDEKGVGLMSLASGGDPPITRLWKSGL